MRIVDRHRVSLRSAWRGKTQTLRGMITRFFLGALLAIAGISALAQEKDVVIGVVEEVPGVCAGERSSMKVRALFSRKSSGWAAYKSNCADSECLMTVTGEYPREVTWFVGLNGRQIGRVVARTPNSFQLYAHIGLQDIVDGKAPAVGKRSYEYGGFGGNELRRPLVAASKPYFNDPILWKRTKITLEVRERVLALLKAKMPKLCREGLSDEKPLVPFRYGTKNLEIRAHRSNNGAWILTVGVKGAYYCEGGAGDGSPDLQAFAVTAAGKSQFLGSGLMLVDAGDYDNDGESELVFALSQYNRGGYVLFSADFTERARFDFGYH